MADRIVVLRQHARRYHREGTVTSGLGGRERDLSAVIAAARGQTALARG